MSVNLGPPEYRPYCTICGQVVGGFYYEISSADQRLKDHHRDVHEFKNYWLKEWNKAYGAKAGRS